MSADFLFVYASVDEPQQDWIKYITGMESEEAFEFAEYAEEYGIWLNDQCETSEEIKAALVEAVQDAYDEKRPDTGRFTEHGRTYVLTGGMSWGDDPTEAWVGILTLSALQSFVNEGV